MGDPSGDADDLGGDAHGSGVLRHLAEHHGVGRDPGVVTHPEGPQHLGSAADEHVVSDGGMALAVVLAGAAQGDAMIDQAVVADLGGLADDDAHPVVNDQAAADLGAGVDLNAGDVAGQLGVQAGQEGKVVTVEPVGDAVEDDGVDAGVEEKDLQLAAGGRVALLIGAQQFTQ